MVIAASPAFAADTPAATCTGKSAPSQVDKCNNQPCTYVYSEDEGYYTIRNMRKGPPIQRFLHLLK